MSKPYNWVPISGEFDGKDGTVVFRGRPVDAQPVGPDSTSTAAPAVPSKLPALGTILSDQYLATGAVSAEVNFEKVGWRTACEIVLGYDVERRAFIAAGITGDDLASFAIREWQPGTPGSQAPAEQPQWVPLTLGGDRSFIKPGQAYTLRASVRGSRVTLEIDGVRVARSEEHTPELQSRLH